MKGVLFMSQLAMLGEVKMLKKRISVSQKRQITLPVDFFNTLGIGQEVECYVQNDAIIIRPVRGDSGEFDEQILADLISQGITGENLLSEFKKMRKQVRPAVESLIADATAAAIGNNDFNTYEDIFGSEDN